MAEEFELYAPDPESNRVLVLYRGEESHALPYLDVKSGEKVEVKHKGRKWGTTNLEERYKYYDEPSPERTVEVTKEEEIDVKQSSKDEEPADEPIFESVDVDYFESREGRNIGLFLAGTLLGLLVMYFLLFVLGPYIIIVP